MRKELQLIEQIENYLLNKMENGDKMAFESQLNNNRSLQEQVEFQQNLMEGIQRLGLKNKAAKARKRYRFQKVIKWVGITTIVAVGLVATYFYLFSGEGEWRLFGNSDRENTVEIQSDGSLISLDENDSLSCFSNSYLDQEFFQIQTNRDTVIESADGLVIFIPANAFETDAETLEFLVQGALNPQDILYAGLNTQTVSGDTLETGGMFYLDAFVNGQRVPLIKEIVVDIPANPTKTEMQLYDGVKNDLGELLWTNPKPLTKPLVSVEITDLDFYPPGYESKMEEWGYLNKQFKDSLYYAFASECADDNPVDDLLSEDDISVGRALFNGNCASCHFPNRDMTGPSLAGSRQRWIKNSSEENFYAYVKNSKNVIDSGDEYANKLFKDWNGTVMTPQPLTNKQIDQIFAYVEYVANRKTSDLKNVSSSPIAPFGVFMPIPQDDMPGNIDDMIDWNFEVVYESIDMARIEIRVEQKRGWHIYSQVQPNGAIPMPTQFNFEPNYYYDLVGKTEEFGAKLIDNDGFPERSFSGTEARFSQRIRIKTREAFKIKLDYSFMACKTACLPPEFRTEEITIFPPDFAFVDSTSVCTECGVNPASVKTIWNATFNNTNLATKEFEERMPFIHQTCDNGILELYVRNLELDLSAVDALAAQKLGENLRATFSNFAARGDGKVELATAAQQKLNAYYTKKRRALQKAIELTNANYWNEQNLANAEMRKNRQAYDQNNEKNKNAVDQKELEFNTQRVYRDLGMTRPNNSRNSSVSFGNNANGGVPSNEAPIQNSIPIQPNRPILRANINNLGWKNVDCLMAVSYSRENAKIRGYNGKTTEITYSPLNMFIHEADKYSLLNVYVVPAQFNSFVKLKGNKGNFTYRLNDALTYKMVAVGFIDGGFFYTQQDVKTGDSEFILNAVTKPQWDNEIKNSLASINNMSAEIDYLDFAKKDQQRQNKNKALINLREKARPYVFPCRCKTKVVIDEIEIIGPELGGASNNKNVFQ